MVLRGGWVNVLYVRVGVDLVFCLVSFINFVFVIVLLDIGYLIK